MDFDGPDVMKDFPGLYASELCKKCTNDSDYSDETEKSLKKDILIAKRKDKKDKKDKDRGYAALEGESSAEDTCKSSKSPTKSKKTKSFKFTKSKEKREKSRDKERDKKDKGKKVKSGEEFVDIAEALPIFGVALDVAVERSRCHDGIDVPLPVRESIDYLEASGMTFEGIYKISGTKSKVLQIKKMYNNRQNVQWPEYDVPTATSLLKMFLRDLPEPLFTNDQLIRFEEAGAILNFNTREKHLKILVDNLPKHNKLLLGWTLVHLDNVTLNEKQTKVSKQTLAAALNHTFHASSRLLHALLHHCRTLFPETKIIKYIPPLIYASQLPDDLLLMELELTKQESLLTQLHREIYLGYISKEREELLWEVQRLTTQLKRKIKTAYKDQECAVVSLEDQRPVPKAVEELPSSAEPKDDPDIVFLRTKNSGLAKLHTNLVQQIQQERDMIHVLSTELRNESLAPPPCPTNTECLDEIMKLLQKENQILQIKKINLVRKIVEQQEMCIELTAKLYLLSV